MRTTRRVSGLSAQFDLFVGVPAAAQVMRQVKTAADSGRRFISGHPDALFVGTVRLEQYLRDLGEHAPLRIAQLLDEQDWGLFESRYAASGRAPYAPRGMMGLILYGVMRGVYSLRELERLARLDVGCMWVCGGITPDHANIGRFIVLHEMLLTQDFFESLTRTVLRVCGSSSVRFAGDGTVIESACSHYGLLKEQAVRQHAQAMRAQAERAPENPQAQQRVAQADQCQVVFEQRKVNRQNKGKRCDSLCISATEPEAMVQKLKRGRGVGPSYKPSVLVDEHQSITALAVDASSETGVVARMLDQAARITGSAPVEVLLDAGYFHDDVIDATLQRDISLLCPSRLGQSQGDEKAVSRKLHKSQFKYDPDGDTYRCPAGQRLRRIVNVSPSATNRAHSIYACASCEGCLLRGHCTTTSARKIKRYPQDEARDALRQVMQQAGAQRVFRQRKAMVEPVFARLRGQQTLDRFRRRGLAAVTREFALHALAYNLARAVRQALEALLSSLRCQRKRLKNVVCRFIQQFSPSKHRLQVAGLI